ncbi:Pectin lyase-like superfamily protein, partial [Zea mays]
MAFISNIAVKAAAVAALLLVAAVSPAARAAAVAVAGGAPSVPAGPLDIAQLGAKGDGKSDSTPMILKAWKNACEATGVQKIVIPPGNYLTGGLELKGPCKSSIIIRLDGNLLGTGDLSAYQRNWIEIENVENLSINGHGTIDGQGALVWSKNQCQHSYNCKILPNGREGRGRRAGDGVHDRRHHERPAHQVVRGLQVPVRGHHHGQCLLPHHHRPEVLPQQHLRQVRRLQGGRQRRRLQEHPRHLQHAGGHHAQLRQQPAMPGRAARQRRHQVQWIRQQDHGRLQECHRQVHRLGKGAGVHLNQLTNMH